MYLYHREAFVRRMVPNFMKLNETNVPLNPVVSGPKKPGSRRSAKSNKTSEETTHSYFTGRQGNPQTTKNLTTKVSTSSKNRIERVT